MDFAQWEIWKEKKGEKERKRKKERRKEMNYNFLFVYKINQIVIYDRSFRNVYKKDQTINTHKKGYWHTAHMSKY